MNWVKKAPSRGDMVRVRIGSIYHFGICTAEDEIIQFGLAPTVRKDIPDSDIEVISTDVDAFLAGGELEVAEEDAIEVIVVVLSRVCQYAVKVLTALIDYCCQANNLGTSTHDNQELEFAIIGKFYV